MARQLGVSLVSGGTDNHLVVVDVGASGLTGKEVELALDQVHITVNKNTIPFETKSPFVTSGVRLGTPAVSSRGMGTAELSLIGTWIAEVCMALKDAPAEQRVVPAAVADRVRKNVKELCQKFPIYS